MTNEILRFIVVRPAQRAPKDQDASATILAYRTSGPTPFKRAVETSATREVARKIVSEFLANPDNKIREQDLHVRLVDLLDCKLRGGSTPEPIRLRQMIAEFATELGMPEWESDTSLDRLKQLDALLFDRLLGIVMAGGELLKEGTALERMIRVVELLVRLGGDRNGSLTKGKITSLLRARPILPRLNIPVDRPRGQEAENQTPSGEDGKPMQPDFPTMEALKKAREELQLIAERITESRTVNIARDDTVTGWLDRFRRQTNSAQPATARKKWRDQLSETAKTTLSNIGSAVGTSDLHGAVGILGDIIESRSAIRPIQSAQPQRRILGNQLLSTPSRALSPIKPNGSKDGEGSLDAPPTVPQGMGESNIPQRGPLYIVRQKLKRYDIGEIAHIENILQGENHERTFSRSQTTEETLSRTEELVRVEERDLQSSERFELSTETKQTVKDDLKLEAGISISASYGPTVGVQANSEMAYDHAQEKSNNIASNYAREVSNRAQSRIETKVSEQRTIRSQTEMRELARHVFDNSNAGAKHVRGIYRWVNKIYELQVVNYGIRDLYNFFIPEPAAFWRFVQLGRPIDGVTIEPPRPPSVPTSLNLERPLHPSDLNEHNYDEFVALYGAKNVLPPLPTRARVGIVLQNGAPQGEDRAAPGVSAPGEIQIPDGYASKWLRFNGSSTGSREAVRHYWDLEIGGHRFVGEDNGYYPQSSGSNTVISGIEPDSNQTITFEGRTGKLPVALYHRGMFAVAASVEVFCERTEEALEGWQLATYGAIMEGFERQKSAYDEQVATARNLQEGEIEGRNPAANEKIIRDELKRSALTLVTGQRFDRFDSMRSSAGSHGFPEIALADAGAEGRYVAFFEQAFEWENMTFVFYPYFWGKKKDWPLVSQLDDADYLFAQFLRAGFARVQVPVRPKFEPLVAYTLDPMNWSGDVWVGEEPPGFETDGAMAFEEEMRFQTGGANAVTGNGLVTLKADTADVTGVGTAFSDDDIDRELIVNQVSYRIIGVDASQQILKVAAPLPSADAKSLPYALGPKLVGLPWEITIPTTLVYLQADDKLNP